MTELIPNKKKLDEGAIWSEERAKKKQLVFTTYFHSFVEVTIFAEITPLPIDWAHTSL